jgi:predicted dehydrogenase
MSESSKPGAVIVGTSFGVFTHLRALRAAGFDAKALVGRDAKKTRDRARLLDVPLGLTSLDEAMALPGVSLVTIATPPHTHRDVARTAAGAGKHVLCEKPFALNLAEARDMLAAVEQAGVVHMIGTEFRFATAQALLRRAVQDGLIGAPKHFFHVMHVPAIPGPSEHLPGWWMDRSLGGGTMGAWGVHVIDQVRSTLGEFAAVHATVDTLSPRPGMTADDTFTLQFRLVSGVDGSLACSMASAGPPMMTTRIAGENGTLWIQDDAVWIADDAGWRPLPVPDELVSPPPVPFPHTELVQAVNDKWHVGGADLAPYTRLFELMRARMEGRESASREAPATFRDGVASQAVLDAARLAAAERRWIEIAAI